MNVDCQETQFSCREDLRVTRTVLQAYVESVDGGSPMYSVQVGNDDEDKEEEENDICKCLLLPIKTWFTKNLCRMG